MKPHRTLIKILVMLLLFAQQGAYAHAVTHLGKQGSAKEQLAHAKACNTCASFENISGVAPVSAPVLFALDVTIAQVPQPAYVFHPRTVTFFQGRAPPYSL